MSRIIFFKADNFQTLKAVEFQPDEHLVKIAGKNGAGKTSVLESIKTTLIGGKNLESHIQTGKKQSDVKLDIGDYIVEQVITSKKNCLKLIDKKTDAEVKKPRSVLQTIVGELGFNPLQFISQSAKEQVDNFLKLNGIDLSDLDEQIKSIFDWRTHKGRELKDAEGMVKTFDTEKYIGLTDNPVDVSELSETYQTSVEHNSKRESLSNDLVNRTREYEDVTSQINELAKRKISLENDVQLLTFEVENFVTSDIDSIKQQMDSSNETNHLINERTNYKQAVKKKIKLSNEYEEETEKLDKIKSDKAGVLQKLDIDLEGLVFTDEGFEFNGIPLSQCCKSEQIKVSIWIAMKMNPKLKVVLMPDYSLLDKDSQATVYKMAVDNDFQVWAEVVTEDTETGIYLEEGEVQS